MRCGLVEDQQVQLVDVELAGRLRECVERLVEAVVAHPNLRLDEDLVARNARAADALADPALVSVRGGGVDVAVAGLERGDNRGRRLIGWGLEDAEAEGRHADAVVQGGGSGEVMLQYCACGARTKSGPGGARTHDQRIKSPMLYRLSYRPDGTRVAVWGSDFAGVEQHQQGTGVRVLGDLVGEVAEFPIDECGDRQ